MFEKAYCGNIFTIVKVKQMLITYKEFCDFLTNRIQTGKDFYLSLLENVIENPSRYCGLFRLSNAKTKLIQNVTQSKEIKFGDIIEEITTQYLARMGYENFEKNLGRDSNGDELHVDQYFTDGKDIYFVEMKIRDDHDSTKKRGQYSNFRKKLVLLINRHPGKHIIAIMWFVDNGLEKNKKYYLSEMRKETFFNADLRLFYGQEFFEILKNGLTVWNELIGMLKNYRFENSKTNVDIPDFGSSQQILEALTSLSPTHWKKLMSDNEQYQLLRSELFSSGNNLHEAAMARDKKR